MAMESFSLHKMRQCCEVYFKEGSSCCFPLSKAWSHRKWECTQRRSAKGWLWNPHPGRLSGDQTTPGATWCNSVTLLWQRTVGWLQVNCRMTAEVLSAPPYKSMIHKLLRVWHKLTQAHRTAVERGTKCHSRLYELSRNRPWTTPTFRAARYVCIKLQYALSTFLTIVLSGVCYIPV